MHQEGYADIWLRSTHMRREEHQFDGNLQVDSLILSYMLYKLLSSMWQTRNSWFVRQAEIDVC